MKNKNVGFLIAGVSIIIFAIILIFNLGLNNLVNATCSHGPECTMYQTIKTQTYFSIAIATLVLIIGLFLVFAKEQEKIIEKTVIKKIKEKKKKLNLEGLNKDEKQVIELLQQENNAMFQSTLMEKLEIGKVKTTRLLDKLEAKQLIERKRRGMNNIIVLKNS